MISFVRWSSAVAGCRRFGGALFCVQPGAFLRPRPNAGGLDDVQPGFVYVLVSPRPLPLSMSPTTGFEVWISLIYVLADVIFAVLRVDFAIRHGLRHVCTVGEDADFVLPSVAELFLGFSPRYRCRPTGINERERFLAHQRRGTQAARCSPWFCPVDVSVHRDVEHVLVAFAYRAGFKSAVGDRLPMPSANLLFGDAGVADEPPVMLINHTSGRRADHVHCMRWPSGTGAARVIGGNKAARVA